MAGLMSLVSYVIPEAGVASLYIFTNSKLYRQLRLNVKISIFEGFSLSLPYWFSTVSLDSWLFLNSHSHLFFGMSWVNPDPFELWPDSSTRPSAEHWCLLLGNGLRDLIGELIKSDDVFVPMTIEL